MDLKGRAFYNLLRETWLENPSLEVYSWQVEDYRQLSDKILWKKLKDLKAPLTKAAFLAHAETYDNPEDLAIFLADGNEEIREPLYLLIFEIWRREFPHRPTLSIFCDELDRLITLHDRKELEDYSPIETILGDLEKILDDSVDGGMPPQEAFSLIGDFCAHDVESFLYDYLAEIINKEEELAASEWLEGFYDYMQDRRWFDFLRTRLLSLSNRQKGDDQLIQLLESLQEDPDLDLSLEITAALAKEGDPLLFRRAILQCLDCIETEEDFQDLLAIAASYHRCLDQEAQETALENLFAKRSHHPLTSPFNRSDADVKILLENLYIS